MDPAFTVIADRKRDLLVIQLGGFFGASDVEQFAAEKRVVQSELNCAPNRHLTLVDVTECRIQPQDVFDGFATLIAEPRYKARRIAFVTGTSLARIQVRRLVKNRPDARCFEDRAAAEMWLLADDDSGQCALTPSARI